MLHVRKIVFCLVLTLVLTLVVSGLCIGADKFPSKPIQVIVPFAAGGSNDLLARAVA